MGPGLDQIFIRLGSAPPMPPSLPGLHAHTCVGTLPRWEPMRQYLVKITSIQVDITFIILKLIDGVPSHVKDAQWLYVTEYCHIGSQRGRIPTQMQAERLSSEGDVGGAGPSQMKM
jgi:hypothetical protein